MQPIQQHTNYKTDVNKQKQTHLYFYEGKIFSDLFLETDAIY